VPYRDSTSALKHASLIIWTKGESRPGSEAGAAGKPWVRVRYRLRAPENASRAHWLVTGVADGREVARLARESGYRIERHVSFPDHARYAESMVQQLMRDAAQAGARVALTGKDWVKWREIPGITGRDVSVLEPELEWQEGREAWNRVLWGQ
jgi:tetraacyldisaccharide-1-P 4'-kinase